MSNNPTATPGTGTGGLTSLIQYLQMAKGANDVLGGLRTRNLSRGLGGVMGVMSGYKGLQTPGSPPIAPPAPMESNAPTSQSTFGMTRDEFMRLDPALRERMLQQILGR
jgi:hypothetical protein